MLYADGDWTQPAQRLGSHPLSEHLRLRTVRQKSCDSTSSRPAKSKVGPVSGYQRRIIDDELDELLPHLPAIAIEGPKGVGKTETAKQRAATILKLDEPAEASLLDADPQRLEREPAPILIDEWQRFPRSWDLVRRSVDENRAGGRFLLTGSAAPTTPPTHSGAARIVRLRLRPLSLAERGLTDRPTVSLRELLTGNKPDIKGTATMELADYTEEILASGFPAIRGFAGRARTLQLDSYLSRIVDRDMDEAGLKVRRPALLRGWLAAYAAASSTSTAYSTILDAATPGDADKPAKATTIAYREALTRLWLLDPIPGWIPEGNLLTRLAQAPKHHLADPALAARLLGATASGLLRNTVATGLTPADGVLLGALFESLVTLSVRVYSQPVDATVHHLRTQNGDHEVDLIVEGPDRQVVALEAKLAADVTNNDIRHLLWLRERLGKRLADAAVITTGQHAYRRADGIAVIPASLLGP